MKSFKDFLQENTVEETTFVSELHEKHETTIPMSAIPNGLKQGWGIADTFLEIFKLPSKASEYKDFDVIRFGGTSTGDVYFWDGGVLHLVVQNTLRLFWDLALIYNKGNDYLTLSENYMVEPNEFKKYMETDMVYKKILSQIKENFPKIKYVKINNEKLKIG